MKDKFSLYCAHVIGVQNMRWSVRRDCLVSSVLPDTVIEGMDRPHDDLNQLAEVVEKLMLNTKKQNYQGFDQQFMSEIRYKGIKQAFIDFVISTMPEDFK